MLPVKGFTTYYNPGIMDEVIAYRVRVGDITPCPECIGHVALIREGDINRRVWLRLDESTVEGPFLVTDCAHTWDVAPLVGRGWGVDLDYHTAKRWGFKMRTVAILDAPPAGWKQTVATLGSPAAAAAAATPQAIALAAPTSTPTYVPTATPRP